MRSRKGEKLELRKDKKLLKREEKKKISKKIIQRPGQQNKRS